MVFGSAGTQSSSVTINATKWKVVLMLILSRKNSLHIFSTAYSANDTSRANSLYDEYINARVNYSGFPLTSTKLFDAELLGNTNDNLSRGKAAGLDSLTSEIYRIIIR